MCGGMPTSRQLEPERWMFKKKEKEKFVLECSSNKSKDYNYGNMYFNIMHFFCTSKYCNWYLVPDNHFCTGYFMVFVILLIIVYFIFQNDSVKYFLDSLDVIGRKVR